MSLNINTNMAALNTGRILGRSTNQLNKSLERLSSGLRINRAADDAAGLSIAENFNSIVKGTQMAQRNAQDGVSLVQTAEGALSEVTNILQRMRELSVQSATGTQNDDSREALNDEFQQLIEQINDIATETEFNGINLLDTANNTVTLQVGARVGQTLEVTLQSITADFDPADATDDVLGFEDVFIGGVDPNDASSMADASDAENAINVVDAALSSVNELRSALGAAQNRLEFTMNTLGIEEENAQASESAIRDADIARETMTFTRNQILQQAGTGMLAQANIVPQNALQLLA